VDGVKFVSSVADELAGVHGMEEGGLGGGVVENDGIIRAAKSLRERARLAATEGHGVGRGRGSDGLNTGRGGRRLRGGGRRRRFRLGFAFAPSNSGEREGG